MTTHCTALAPQARPADPHEPVQSGNVEERGGSSRAAMDRGLPVAEGDPLPQTAGIALLGTDEIEKLGREDAAELNALLQFAGRELN